MTIELLLQLGSALVVGFGGAWFGAWLQRNNTAKIALNDARRVVYTDYVSTALSIAEFNIERLDNALPVEVGMDESMHEALGNAHYALLLISSEPVLQQVEICTQALHKAIDSGELLERLPDVKKVITTMRTDLLADRV